MDCSLGNSTIPMLKYLLLITISSRVIFWKHHSFYLLANILWGIKTTPILEIEKLRLAVAGLGLESAFATKLHTLFATTCCSNMPNRTFRVNWMVSMLKQTYLIVNTWLEYYLGNSSDHQMEGNSSLKNSQKLSKACYQEYFN